jgi:hypothetical protein
MRGLPIRTHFAFGLAGAICVCWANSACCQVSAKQSKSKSEIEHCKHIRNELVRTRCYQEANSSNAVVPQQQPTASGTWQLARTPNPAGGPDSISITKMANATPSDQDVAGLTLRCGEGATTDVLVVLGAALPARTHPKVTVVAGAITTEFTATVASPGALVLLPEKASALLEKTWQSVPELAVSITDNNRSLRGVIPLNDISTAIQTLQSNCPKAVHGRK